MPASLPASLDRLGYAQSLLERHSAERSGPTPTLADTPDASLLLFCGDVPVLRVTEGGATCLLAPEDAARAGRPSPELFLGRVGGRPAFAGALPADAAALYRDDPAYRVLDARAVAVEGAVPAPEMGVLATAKSLLGWHARHGFCANCGHATTLSCGGFRRDCAACGTEHFPRTDPVVIMLVTNGDRCLLGRQARFAPSVYSCLAGFLEPGETIEDAVRRESFEEVGLTIGAVRYHASQPWPFPSSLMIGCVAESWDSGITLDPVELADARWFARDEVAAMLEGRHPEDLTAPPPLAIAHLLMRAFVERRA